MAGFQLDAERLFQHHADLLLGGGAVADDGLLGLAGGVFRYGSDAGLETGDDGGALGPAELQHDLGVLAVEGRLDRQFIRMVGLADLGVLLW